MKKLLKIAISIFLLLAIPAVCFATETIDYEAKDAAESLNKIGLFSGTSINEDGTPNFSLDRVPTRSEAIVMLVKLLGKDKQANAKEWETPFTDVEDWAAPYVGYAYDKGYTAGTGETTFGSKDPVTAQMYLTFVLKALDYIEGTDFIWSEASAFSDELGITAGQYSVSGTFTRGDIAKISVNALNSITRNTSKTLLARLLSDGVISYSEHNNFIYEMGATLFSSTVQCAEDGSFSFTGVGAGSIRHFDFPQGQYYCYCEYEGADSFRADLYYGEKATDYWMIGNLWSKGTYYAPLYEKYFLFDMAGKELTNTHIEINATGRWTIHFKPFTTMDFNGKLSGKGNYVSGLFTADAANYIIRATHTGKTMLNVHVVKYDPNDGLDFYRNAIEDYNSKEYKELLNLEQGSQYYFCVVADGSWTIELSTTQVLSKNTKIDAGNHVYSGEGNELITGIKLPEGQWYAECTYTELRNNTAKGFEGKLFFDINGKKYWPMEGSATGSGSALLNKCALFDLKGQALENGALQVKCNGKWTVTFKKVQTTTETSFSGRGAVVTKAFKAPAETVNIKFDYTGTDSYKVRIQEYETTNRNSRAQVVFEGTGNSNSTTEFTLNPEKHYYFTVDCSGTWSISVNR